MTESWTDTLLISHEGPGLRRYGDFAFDGEFALVRETEDGAIERVIIHRGANLSRAGQVIVASENLLDTFSAQWQGEPLVIAATAGIGVAVWIDAQVGGLAGLLVATVAGAGLYIGLLAVADRMLDLGLAQSLLRVFPQLQRGR